jgi:hypothetical protein
MTMVRIESSPDMKARIGEIVEEVQEWAEDDKIYLVEDLIEMLQK